MAGPTAFPSIVADTRPPVAVFIGDSYTVGVGAVDHTKRWTTMVAASQGWQEDNLGRGGTGYLTEAGVKACGSAHCPNYLGMLAQVITINPSVVVVAGGLNDQLQDPEREKIAIETFYRDLRKGLPSAQIVAVGPSSSSRDPGRRLAAINNEVRGSAAAIGAVYVNLLAPSVITTDPALMTKSKIGNATHAAIAGRVEDTLENK
ncbi:MAG TPA: SGNH/GDSL hydrolase family protein [Humibacter sp.]|nr:SGNH/GDSL hydrolase family protein [Humibacter sp.]